MKLATVQQWNIRNKIYTHFILLLPTLIERVHTYVNCNLFQIISSIPDLVSCFGYIKEIDKNILILVFSKRKRRRKK